MSAFTIEKLKDSQLKEEMLLQARLLLSGSLHGKTAEGLLCFAQGMMQSCRLIGVLKARKALSWQQVTTALFNPFIPFFLQLCMPLF